MYSIKKNRGLNGISQQELANYLGVSKAYISLLESSKTTSISVEQAQKMADLFKCTIVDVYGMDILKYQPQTYLETKKLIKMLLEYSDLYRNEDKIKILEEVKEEMSWG